MFTILTSSPEDMLQAMFMLSYYSVMFEAFSDGEDPFSTEIVVKGETRDGDLQMAEMCFQMNYRQVGHICPTCKREKPKEKACGHLTFQGQIGESFLDQQARILTVKEETKAALEEPAVNSSDFKFTQLDDFPPRTNPLYHDTFSMGVPISKRFYATHSDKNIVTIWDMERGKRVRIAVPN